MLKALVLHGEVFCGVDKKNQNLKRCYRTVSRSDFLVTPIVGFSNPEIVEELESLWKIKLYMEDVHKSKAFQESKYDVLRRRRK